MNWLRAWATLVAGFLLLPIAIAAIVAFSSGDRLVFPPPGLGLRWFRAVLANGLLLDGLGRSLVIAAVSTILAAVAGTAAAVALNHHRFRGRGVAQAVVMLPIALPAIALGLGMLFTLPSLGLRAGLLAAILGHAVLGIPYVVAMVTASMANFDRALERASLSLGASPAQTFWRITLPLIRPGILAGAAAAFLMSLDNISLSLFITTGNTLPLRLIQRLTSYADPSIAAMSTLLLVVTLIPLVFLLPLLRK